MNDYELTCLFSKTNKDKNIGQINQIQKIIEEKRGIITLTREGEDISLLPHQRINLAYPIKKNSSADIVTVRFSVDPVGIKEIVEKIRLNKDILRHILIKQIAGTRKKIRRERKEVKIENKEADLQNFKKKQISNGADKTDIFISDDKGKKDIDDVKILKTKRTKKEKIKLEEIGEELDKII